MLPPFLSPPCRASIGPMLKPIFTLALMATLSACIQTTPRLEQHFGEAVRVTMARQIIAPNAGVNPDPVAGIDGVSARAAQDNYRKSFSSAPQTGAFTVGVSSGK